MAVTREEALAAFGITEDQALALTLFAAALVAQDADNDIPNSPETAAAVVKVGGAVALLDAASVTGGGTGYSQTGLADGIAISGISAQITGYEETIEAKRAAAAAENAADENTLQPIMARITELEADPALTTDGLLEREQKRALVAQTRTAQAARTQAAETFAQGVAPIVLSLKERRRRLATGDRSAV